MSKTRSRSVGILRAFPGGLTVRLWVTAPPGKVASFRALLDKLWVAGRTDYLHALDARTVTLWDVERLCDQHGVDALPQVQRYGLLHADVAAWLASFAPYTRPGRSQATYREYRNCLAGGNGLLARVPRPARTHEVKAHLRAEREFRLDRGEAATFNHIKSALLAMTRDLYGRDSAPYLAVKAVERLTERQKRRGNPQTVEELVEFCVELGEVYGAMAWGMAMSGMGWTEYTVDGWEVDGHGLHIRGKKTAHRTRENPRDRRVPLVVVPVRPLAVSERTFWGAVTTVSARLEKRPPVRPYDFRRSYAMLLELAHDDAGAIIAPERQRMYLGHGSDIDGRYRRPVAEKYLAADSAILAAYVAKSIKALLYAPHFCSPSNRALTTTCPPPFQVTGRLTNGNTVIGHPLKDNDLTPEHNATQGTDGTLEDRRFCRRSGYQPE